MKLETIGTSVREAAQTRDVSERWIRYLCSEGVVEAKRSKTGAWIINPWSLQSYDHRRHLERMEPFEQQIGEDAMALSFLVAGADASVHNFPWLAARTQDDLWRSIIDIRVWLRKGDHLNALEELLPQWLPPIVGLRDALLRYGLPQEFPEEITLTDTMKIAKMLRLSGDNDLGEDHLPWSDNDRRRARLRESGWLFAEWAERWVLGWER